MFLILIFNLSKIFASHTFDVHLLIYKETTSK